MSIQRTPMTREGHTRLKDELERLKRVERPATTKAIAEARAHGDLSENAEYHAAREKQSFIEARINDLEGKLGNAEVEETDPARGRISIMAPLARTLIGKKVGDTVTAELPGGKKTFEILGANFPWDEKA